MSPFSAPFSGAPPSERPLLPRRNGCILGGNPRSSGGTGKAEAAQCAFLASRIWETAGAGIWPEAVPRKMDRRKRSKPTELEDWCGIGRAL
jgi:hypothetical protein